MNFMITRYDPELLGVSDRLDAMGFLVLWSERARQLVPHLTEQSDEVLGFQLLVEAFALWERYEPRYPHHAGRLADLFLLFEQVFARIVWRETRSWPLPGARRMAAQGATASTISLVDNTAQLLDRQLGNGVWGIYRGAAGRAGLLHADNMCLSDETSRAVTHRSALRGEAEARLFKLLGEAMDGASVTLPNSGSDPLVVAILETARMVPLADHLRERLIDAHPLNKQLAAMLAAQDLPIDYRSLLVHATHKLPAHRDAIEEVLRCEDLLAVVESVFSWLCASRGQTVEAAVAELPVDLQALGAARDAASAARYASEVARGRHHALCARLDTSSRPALARAVLALHGEVCAARQRSPWVWEEDGRLQCDMEMNRPNSKNFQIGLAWHNNYYLPSLGRIAKQLMGRVDG